MKRETIDRWVALARRLAWKFLAALGVLFLLALALLHLAVHSGILR